MNPLDNIAPPPAPPPELDTGLEKLLPPPPEVPAWERPEFRHVEKLPRTPPIGTPAIRLLSIASDGPCRLCRRLPAAKGRRWCWECLQKHMESLTGSRSRPARKRGKGRRRLNMKPDADAFGYGEKFGEHMADWDARDGML